MLFVEAGDRLPASNTDILFVDDSGRRGGFDLEASISGWYCASAERKARGRAAALDLATRPSASPEDRALARRTAPYWTRSATELLGPSGTVELLPDVPEGWSRFNPSLARDGEGVLALVRSSNYVIDEEGRYVIADPRNVVRTRNYLLRLDGSLAQGAAHELEDATGSSSSTARTTPSAPSAATFGPGSWRRWHGSSRRAVTDPFHLVGRGVEFAAGLLADPGRDELLLSYGLRDRSAHIVRLPLGKAVASLREL